MSGPSPWTPERVAMLRTEWATGAPTAEIGRRMGITKSAVIGKAHRMRLPAREAPANIAKQKSRGVVSRPAARSNRELPVAGSRAASPSRPRAASISGVSSAVERRAFSQPERNLPGAVGETPPRRVFSRACCFPMWRDKDRPTHVYCEAPVAESADGKAMQYCAAHYAECYNNLAKSANNPPPAGWLKNRLAMRAHG